MTWLDVEPDRNVLAALLGTARHSRTEQHERIIVTRLRGHFLCLDCQQTFVRWSA